MNFIERLFGKREKKCTNETMRLAFEDVEALVRAEYKKEHDGSAPLIREIYRNIGHSIECLRDVRKSLLEADHLENASKRMEKVGDSNRANMTYNLELIIDKLKLPQNDTLGDAISFYTESRSVMKTFVDNTQRSQLYIKALYPQEFEKMKDGLTELEDNFGELFCLINEKQKRTGSLGHICNELENIRQTRGSICRSQRNICDLEPRYRVAEDMFNETVARLGEIERSDELRLAKKLDEEINEVEMKLASSRADIDRLFSPLSKAISRMERQDVNEIRILGPGDRATLASIKDKTWTFTQSELNSFLDELSLRTMNKELGMKDQMNDKIQVHIEKLKDPSTLGALQATEAQYSARLKELKDKMDSMQVYRKKEKLLKEKERYAVLMGSIKEEISLEQMHIECITCQLTKAKSELSSKLALVLGKQVIVTYEE